MSQYDIYRYYCITENLYVRESVPVNNTAPTVCKNGVLHSVDSNSLTIVYSSPRKEDIGLGNINNIKDNLTATTAPTTSPNDNAPGGYSVGSKWINILTNDIWINSGIWQKITETATATNIGSTGVGTYKQKVGNQLEFKKLDSGSNKLTITDDITNNKINIDLVEQNININDLIGSPQSAIIGVSDLQTLSNKNLTDSSVCFVNNDNVSKKVQFDLSNIATSTTRTIQMPDTDLTLIGASTVDTLIHKTWGDNLNMDGHRIINVGAPINSNDVVTKLYVDNLVTGLDIKASVVVAQTNDLSSNTSISTSNYSNNQFNCALANSGILIMDGISITTGARILLKDQIVPEQNGIWVTNISGNSLILSVADDFDNVRLGTFCFVEQGDNFGGTGWVVTKTNPIIFSKFSGSSQIVAGDGIAKSGNTLNIGGSDTILVKADNIEVNSSNIINQPLLSSGIIGNPAIFGPLILSDENATSGALPMSRGGTNAISFDQGSRLIATNSANTSLESTNLDPTKIVTLSGSEVLTNKTINVTNNTVTNISDTNIKSLANINATKIGNGTVTNTNFQHLIGTKSNLQTQIDTHCDARSAHGVVGSVVGTDSLQVLSNKTLVDYLTLFQNSSDSSKKVQFNLSGLTSQTTRIISLPDATTTLLGTDTNQTITNKLIDARYNNLQNITNASIKTDAAINATKIGDGSVTNSSFKHLSGVSSNIQSQINNHLLDINNPHHVTKTQVGLGNVQNLKTNLSALVGPVTSDDLNLGYGIGSLWINILEDKAYMCIDCSLNSAIWKEISNGGTGSGEINSGENIGVDGVGLFKEKNGTMLEFKNISIGSNKLSLIDNIDKDTVTIDILPKNININSLLGAPASQVVGISDTQLLSNKILDGTSTYIQDSSDPTKKIKFAIDGIASGITRIITMPDVNVTLVGVNSVQTLTNKTIDADLNTVINISDAHIKNSASINANKIGNGSVTNSQFQYLNALTNSIVSVDASQILTNKILPDSTIFYNYNDISKKIKFDLSDISTSVTRTIKIPNATTTLVGIDTSSVLTNKIIVGSSNIVEATQLATTNSSINISNSVSPISGMVLKATSPTTAIWQNESGGVSRKFDAYYLGGVDTVVGTAWVDVPLNVNRIMDIDFSHIEGSTEIEINTTAHYMVIARCSTFIPFGNTQTTTQMRLVQDMGDGDGYSEIPGTLGYMLNKQSSDGYNTATVSFIDLLVAGSKIKMQCVRITAGNTNLLPKGCSVMIVNV